MSAEQYATNSIQQHLETHELGRAPDITVDYVVSADCSVCSDGGDVQQEDSEVLQCAKCDTTWNINGSSGELAKAENS